MSYHQPLNIEGYSIVFSDFGIILNPETQDLSDPGFQSALTTAFRVYPSVRAVFDLAELHHMMADFKRGSDDFMAAYKDLARIAMKQTDIELPQATRDVIYALYHPNDIQDNNKKYTPKKNKKGHIYLLKSAHGHYKIGRSINAENRASLLDIELPFAIELIHYFTVPDMAKAESELHTMFADKRLNGEWFNLTDEDVNYIKSLGGEA